MEHFNVPQRRKAEFIKVPNTLKIKVGSGGLSEEILHKAQTLLEHNTVDFVPLADMYLDTLMRSIEQTRHMEDETEDIETHIASILYPTMQLKANGGMFHYPLVTKISDRLIQFLEVLIEPDEQAIEIILAFYTTIRAIIHGRITGDGGEHGEALFDALNGACYRYLEKYPKNVADI